MGPSWAAPTVMTRDMALGRSLARAGRSGNEAAEAAAAGPAGWAGRQHGYWAVIASSFFWIWGLGTAPISWSRTLPSFTNRMVGIDRMP